ncbi:MAG: C_GCAxxG_C_C family protein [Candidatus Tectomicrobia bacterium]|uniref:C_GCAxxG_C_C family protein n=1 Tax=Tectimicrobiota bacterium TaxID=2528274 RepID=A0A932MMQ9_UNCTE|nr:C_GCAxxG_C_C family protein [Candidatus Tectomicrobia bacterium]
MEDEGAFRAGSALAGGVARMGATCGALTGAVMAVGLEVGRARLEDTEQYARAMAPAQEVYRRFEAAEGSSQCLEIHEKLYGRGFLLADPEQRKAFLEAGGHSAAGCPSVCYEAAKIAADVILALREGEA